jgi:hypothetical protein
MAKPTYLHLIADECLLVAQSGHPTAARECPLLGQSGHGEFQSRRTLDRVKTCDGRSTISHLPRAGFDARGSTVSNSSRTKMELRLVNWKHAENGGVELDNGAV